MLVNIFFLLSIFLVLIACFLEVTKRRRIYKISKGVFWMLGVYLAIAALFLQSRGSGSVMNLQR